MTEPLIVKNRRIYGCPICKDEIIGTLQEARDHVNIPLGRGLVLPIGFVFGRKDTGAGDFPLSDDLRIIMIIKSSTVLSSKDIESSIGQGHDRNSRPHDLCYSYENYILLNSCGDKIKLGGGSRYGFNEDSYWFQYRLNHREYCLLSLDQFKDFKIQRIERIKDDQDEMPNEQLIRTFNGIEKLTEHM